MKYKPYSEITVKIRTQLKTVKITSNIFAVNLGHSTPAVYSTDSKFNVFYLHTQHQIFRLPTLPSQRRDLDLLLHAVPNLEYSEVLIDINLLNSI